MTLEWKRISSSQWAAKTSDGVWLYVGPDMDIWMAAVWPGNGMSHDVVSSDQNMAYGWPTRQAAQAAAEEYAHRLTANKAKG